MRKAIALAAMIAISGVPMIQSIQTVQAKPAKITQTKYGCIKVLPVVIKGRTFFKVVEYNCNI